MERRNDFYTLSGPTTADTFNIQVSFYVNCWLISRLANDNNYNYSHDSLHGQQITTFLITIVHIWSEFSRSENTLSPKRKAQSAKGAYLLVVGVFFPISYAGPIAVSGSTNIFVVAQSFFPTATHYRYIDDIA